MDLSVFKKESIAALYEEFRLDHVTYLGQTFYQNSTLWDEPHPLNPYDKPCKAYINDGERPYDPDDEGTDTCTHVSAQVAGHIEYHFSPDNDTLNTKICPDEFSVELINTCGINEDHRGSNHTDIQLDFNPNWVLRGSTLRDLVEGMYRVKSHKFDYNYELFCGSQITKVKNGIRIEFDFDHGS
jgi:hypothetical protein